MLTKLGTTDLDFEQIIQTENCTYDKHFQLVMTVLVKEKQNKLFVITMVDNKHVIQCKN